MTPEVAYPLSCRCNADSRLSPTHTPHFSTDAFLHPASESRAASHSSHFNGVGAPRPTDDSPGVRDSSGGGGGNDSSGSSGGGGDGGGSGGGGSCSVPCTGSEVVRNAEAFTAYVLMHGALLPAAVAVLLAFLLSGAGPVARALARALSLEVWMPLSRLAYHVFLVHVLAIGVVWRAVEWGLGVTPQVLLFGPAPGSDCDAAASADGVGGSVGVCTGASGQIGQGVVAGVGAGVRQVWVVLWLWLQVQGLAWVGAAAFEAAVGWLTSVAADAAGKLTGSLRTRPPRNPSQSNSNESKTKVA